MNVRAQTPELAKHLRAIEEDNRRDREWMADERLEENSPALCSHKQPGDQRESRRMEAGSGAARLSLAVRPR